MKESESQKRATRKYINGKYRPNVYVDKDKQSVIENRINELGFKSANEYINSLIKKDLEN